MEIDFVSLPNELTDLILQSSCLSWRDVINVSCTCHRLHDVCQSNELWKSKLLQRWPKLMKRYSSEKAGDWLNLFRTYHGAAQKVQIFVKGLSPKYYKAEEISDAGFQEMISLMEELNEGEIILHELLEIINGSERWLNLTCKYYAQKALQVLSCHFLTKYWKEHLSLPPSEQKLEEGASLLSQWCQPEKEVSKDAISDKLDNIAMNIVADLPEDMKAKFNNGIPLPFGEWTVDQEAIILQAQNHILYDIMKFAGNSENYYIPTNSYIDQVLERKLGIPISLSILYVAVARRLGVQLFCVNHPSHFLIKWKQHPLATEDNQYTFIDAFYHGKLLNRSELETTPYFSKAIEPAAVYHRMCRNLLGILDRQAMGHNHVGMMRSLILLCTLIHPDDVNVLIQSVRIYVYLNINLEECRDRLQEVEEIQNDQSLLAVIGYLMASVDVKIQENRERLQEKVVQKLRKDNEGVKYSVGMVMKHKRYDYMCVIYGWDRVCMASQEWIFQMGVHNLPNKDKQPFYNVLVHKDGTTRYAAQESLFVPEESDYCQIEHPEVGKYFTRFNGTYFTMNEEKAKIYPDDAFVMENSAQLLTDPPFTELGNCGHR